MRDVCTIRDLTVYVIIEIPLGGEIITSEITPLVVGKLYELGSFIQEFSDRIILISNGTLFIKGPLQS